MKRNVLMLAIGGVLLVLAGCEKAQQAADAVDKAKTFSEDLQKNASKKLQDALPGFAKNLGEKEGSRGEESERKEKEREERDD